MNDNWFISPLARVPLRDYVLDLTVHLENDSLKGQNRTRGWRKRHTLFLSGCHAIASGNNSFSFPKNISLHQSSKSANIEWNLSQTVDDMGLKLANFLCKLQLVWDPFWIVLSLHYTSCITPLTKLSFADILSTEWWIQQSSWLHVNSFLFELDTQYDCIWIWEI